MTPRLRRAWALAAALPLALLVLLYLARAPGAGYYGVGELAQAAAAISVIAPICAALAAREGASLRRGNVGFLAPVRGELAIALRSLWPVLLLGLFGVGLATARMLAGHPRVEADDFLVLATPVAILAGHVSLAYALGRHLTGVFSVPLALVASWLWIVYPVALEPLWIRHLTGFREACCDVATVPARGAIVAPIVLGAAAVLAAAVLLAPVRLAARFVGATVVLAAALATAIPLVDDLGAEPTAPRPERDLRCRGEAPQVCVWPEHERIAALVAAEASTMRARLARAGVATPDTVSEARTAAEGDWYVGLHPRADREAVRVTLLQGLIPEVPPCAQSAPYPAYEAYWPMVLWLAGRAGVGDQPFVRWTTQADWREAAAVERLDPKAQRAWFEANLRALRRCDTEPELVTSR